MTLDGTEIELHKGVVIDVPRASSTRRLAI